MMSHILDTCPTYPKTKLKCKYPITGVDIFMPYLDFLIKRGDVQVVKWDLRKTPIPFEDKRFDVVILSDVLEHLSNIEQASNLLFEAERIARKVVLGLTPNKFQPETEGDVSGPYKIFSQLDNPKSRNFHQQHKILLPPEWFLSRRYKIKIPKQDNHRHTFFVKKMDKNKKKSYFNKIFFKTVIIIMTLFILSTPIHEFGHIFIAQLFGAGIKEVVLLEFRLGLPYFITTGHIILSQPPTFFHALSHALYDGFLFCGWAQCFVWLWNYFEEKQGVR